LSNNKSNIGNALPSYGVGITYSSELESLFKEGLVDVIEIEPQTLWMNRNGNFSMPQEVVQHLNNIPLKKLIHSVGLPVGGTFRGSEQEIELLVSNINDFNSPWASEHLGFNATSQFHTGFFLPPPQTNDGITRSVKSINYLQNKLPVPFAVETGVNYLRPRKNELSDGAFIQSVISEANCGLLLDLHNLYANELNGRQSIESFLKEIDLTRVWEVHLAGGLEMDGFWLDAHSGQMPEPLIDIAMQVVSHLPNLKAIVYEILPSYLPVVGLKKIESELIIIRKIWEKKRVENTSPLKKERIVLNHSLQQINEKPIVNAWEEALGGLAVGQAFDTDTFQLADEPGIEVIQKLVHEFRASMLISVFKLTSRFLMLTLGVDAFKIILRNFWDQFPPHQYASEEALHFASFLKTINLQLPNLYSLLDFEESTLRTLLDNQTRVVSFTHDPFPLLKSLADGKLETMQRQEGNYEIEITPDDVDNELWKILTQNSITTH
jgi:uncharacterized protein (UPF0276 family)